jgi:hypothetical protein
MYPVGGRRLQREWAAPHPGQPPTPIQSNQSGNLNFGLICQDADLAHRSSPNPSNVLLVGAVYQRVQVGVCGS